VADEQEQIKYRNPIKNFGFAMLPHAITLDKELPDGAYRLLALYMKYAHQQETCWPSRERIADELGVSLPTISRHNTALVQLGYITRQKRMGKSWLTWIEDFELNPRLKEIVTEYRKDTQQLPLPDESKMIRQTYQKRHIEEESIKKNQEVEDVDTSSTGASPLAPSTPGAIFLFEELTKEAAHKGRRGPKRFKTMALKLKWEAAEEKLGLDQVRLAVKAALESEIIAVSRVTAWVAKWDPSKPARNNGSKPPRMAFAGMERWVRERGLVNDG
jgi:DNA-binding transcriptional ArsR family regulator